VELLSTLPDSPRWVEARGMLLSGRGRAVASPSPATEATVVAAPSALLAVIVRWQEPRSLARALEQVPGEFTIVAPAETAVALGDLMRARRREPVTLFQLPPDGAARLPDPRHPADVLRADELHLLDSLPPDLRGELRSASAFSPIAAAWVRNEPVAFCYAGWETESHWDVSIDTLERYRRRGCATAAATCLIRRFAQAGKTAVWGATESNVASTRLARTLGFVEVDRLVLWHPASSVGV
jgi:GNAT superfamily N-acetyltransferase